MKFGKSYAEKEALRQKKLEFFRKGKIWFAWHPVRNVYGVWVWMEKVKIEYLVYGDVENLELAAGSRTYTSL